VTVRRTTRITLLPLLAAGLIASAWTQASAAPQNEITILLGGQADMHLRMSRSLQQLLEDHTILVNSITADTEDLDTSRLADSELVIAVGTRATRQLVQADLAVPAVSVLVPKLTFDDIADKYNRAPLTAIYLDQPPARFLSLCRSVVPGKNRVGILWGPTSVSESPEFLTAANWVGMSLVTKLLQENENPVPLISEVLADSDILLARYDSQALNPVTAKWLLYMAYKERIPVVAFSQAYVDAGAIAAIYSTPGQIARQAVGIVKQFLENNGELPLEPAYPDDFSIVVNKSVARSIKITLPDEAELMRQLKQSEMIGSNK
jgi:ABC-type uncharacterized transport system substrate-binding protein